MSSRSIPTPAHQAAVAIVELINSSPRSPRIEEIEAVIAGAFFGGPAPAPSPLLAKAKAIMARKDAVVRTIGRLLDGPEFDDGEAELTRLQAELEDLEAEIPSPPQSFGDLVVRAEIARYGADVRKDGTMAEAGDDDVFVGPAARLVEAVLQMGASSHGPPLMSPAHAEHFREWRRVIDQHMREFANPDEAGKTRAEIEAEEARMGAHMDVITNLIMRIYAVPARTWGDVALYAQAFVWCYWPGLDLHGPEAQSQLEGGPSSEIEDHDIAKLLEAVFAVAGIGHFAEGGRHA
jgi:hypothetical protein